jgi:hypothetical protein
VTAKSDDACVLSEFSVMPGKKLGCGEQGCAYTINPPGHPNTVLKKTKFGEVNETQWFNEACVGENLGHLGLAPRIYKYYKCRGHGYILMEMLTDVEHAFPGITSSGEDHVGLMPADVQTGFIDVLRKMILHGYIHMDNHLGNLGLIAGKPVVFDFGFTLERWFTGRDAEAALAFSIFQMLEHTPTDELTQTVLWKVAKKLVAYNGNATVESMLRVAHKRADNHANVDVYVGCFCYLVVLQLPLRTKKGATRYQNAFYDLIYEIRKNKFPH